ncbi:hypothetical protein [Pelosinus sp. sgz500959]|uniref:hypothetical protein n=1 Tax=Pelosinus sp. sgz500959 TaxID=3242472 RepID=UPI003670E563
MSNFTIVPFTPLTERIAVELPELSSGLHQLKLMIGEQDFNKYINSLISLKRSGDLLLLITGKAMYYSIIEKKFLPMLKESFKVAKVRVINQGIE